MSLQKTFPTRNFRTFDLFPQGRGVGKMKKKNTCKIPSRTCIEFDNHTRKTGPRSKRPLRRAVSLNFIIGRNIHRRRLKTATGRRINFIIIIIVA